MRRLSKMKNLVLLFFVLLSSCKVDTNSIFPVTESLTGRSLNVADSLGRVLTLEAEDGYLILRDENIDTYFTMLKPDLSFCTRFGKRGEGPKEIYNPMGALSLRNETLTISDGYKHLVYSFDSLLVHKDNPMKVFKTESEGSIIWMSKMHNSLYVASGVFPNDRRFVIFNEDGKEIASTGSYDIESAENIPFYVKCIAFQSTMVCHPTSNRFVSATRLGGMLDVYELDDSDYTLNRLGGINLFSPHLSTVDFQGTINYAPDKNTRWGYLFMDVDAEYIYALYSGLYQSDGGPFTSGNVVQVFDWDGNPVCELALDRRLLDIAIMGDKMYGLYQDESAGYEVVEYVLPNNLKKR